MSVKHSAELEAAAQAALDAAARTGETQWAVLQAEISPCDVLAAFEASESQDRFYWERPAEGRSIAAFGCAGAIEPRGERRFAEASERAERLRIDGDLPVAADALGAVEVLDGEDDFALAIDERQPVVVRRLALEVRIGVVEDENTALLERTLLVVAFRYTLSAQDRDKEEVEKSCR